MTVHVRAGTPATLEDLVDLEALLAAYDTRIPNVEVADERIRFGTSGHRGSSLCGSFQDLHVAALTQAILELRAEWGIAGPLFVGADSHALSGKALQTVREVLAAHSVDARFAPAGGLVATPLVSHAILRWNHEGRGGAADGIILTPSHNPPEDGGFKYNPPTGGPAEPVFTDAIAARANELLATPDQIQRRAVAANASVGTNYDFVAAYVRDLDRVVDLDRIRKEKIRIAVDPLGGTALPIWAAIRDVFGLDIEILNDRIDPQFSFMHLDHDGIIRMDCSSPYVMNGFGDAMAGFDVGIGNDPDADRHGIVSAKGVMNPNHFLSLAVDHLLRTRSEWSKTAGIGRTVVTSAMIDRVAASHGRAVFEVPVGFKWFVEGLASQELVFGGEESAGASFVAFDGGAWSTDKDGILLGLLAAEMIAVQEQSLDELWAAMVKTHGEVFYARRDTPASAALRHAVKSLNADAIQSDTLGGQTITHIRTHAAGNGEAIGGLKIETADGWVAMRPSGTEDILKVYGESFVSQEHLHTLLDDAEAIVQTLV